MKRNLAIRVLFVAAFCLRTASIFGQAGSASITGRVTDANGAAIVGAKIEIVNTATNVANVGQTNQDGLYNVPSLSPGTYRITVDKDGFARAVRVGVDLHVADVLSIDITLQVGAVGQTVTVVGGAPQVDTTSSALGGLIDTHQITDLPLNGRNYIGLTLMQPGVTLDANEQTNGIYAGSWFSSNGAPIRSNNFLIDGAIMQDQNAGSTADFGGRTLGLDGIQEYRVLTNSIPASFGLLMGSQTIMASKGGSNRFHGDAYDYLRNSVFDAANYFYVPTTASNFRRIPEYIRNNFGGAFGGPIRKDRTFFFAAYEGVQERTGVTNIENVPGSACRGAAGTVVWNGTGTQPVGSIGPCTQLGSNPSGAGTNSVTISAVTAPLLALYPLPNLVNNQETVPYSQPDSDNFGQIRVDHRFSGSDSAFARYTITNDDIVISSPYSQYFSNPKLTRHQYLTLSEDHVFAPWLLNTARLSFSRTAADRYGTDSLTGSQYQFVQGSAYPGIGTIPVGGLTSFGPPASPKTLTKQNIYTLSDDLIASLGKHTVSFGAVANLYRIYGLNPTGAQGTITFGSLATFLLGKPSSVSGVSPGSVLDRTYQFFLLGFYVQDDWHVARNLTVNAGLRYEPGVNYYNEVHGISATLVNRQTDASPTIGPIFAGNPTISNISPRLGIAWDVFGNGKTAIRAGGALLSDEGNLADAFNITKSQPPFSASSSVSNPPNFSLPLSLPTASGNIDYWEFDYHLGLPRYYTYNLAIEQQIPFSIAVQVAYAGSRGTHLLGNEEGNPDIAQPDPGVPGNLFWPGTPQRINIHWASINLIAANKDSYFNAMETTVTKRLTKGFQFQSSYTWAHSIDDAQGGRNDCTATSATNSDPYNFRFDRGTSCFNAIDTWVFNYIYNFPSPDQSRHLLHAVAGGWGTTGIYTSHTGFPFNVWETTDRARTGVFDGAATPPTDRPNWNPAFTGKVIQGGHLQYFNPNAFILQPVGTLGNVGRGSLIGPGYEDLDFALLKENGAHFLGEDGKVQFRAELFNLLNRANFNEPSEAVFAGTLTDTTETPLSTAGQISSTLGNSDSIGTSRQIEFSLRLLW